MFSRAQVRRALQWVPGKQRFGIYRFLPFFFVLGGTMEWIMIKVRVGQETFYDVYRRKASERQYQRRLEDTSETDLHKIINNLLFSFETCVLFLPMLPILRTRLGDSPNWLYHRSAGQHQQISNLLHFLFTSTRPGVATENVS
ncbi:small integral membrane protein 4 isoform X1 [Mesocricetus auratus]|uniref:Small integral membrane protein 4 isoform X1 n=1 Tax=Mesocricetus auratus TaxID=10036 RepID=A0A1U7RE03_MESAU|nr:small integral membrane protein 4 isoform X1 [Mesocricetus auratus]